MKPGTGIPALDEVLTGLRRGDNVVWNVDSVEDYAAVVQPFWKAALDRGESVLYFRYASEAELVPDLPAITRVEAAVDQGFEHFITTIHDALRAAPPNACCVFDMFSDLVREWFSERMVGNLFALTCPYLYALDSVAYFGVLRHFHSFHAIEPISETAQLLIDVYRYRGRLYLHPLKVEQRHSATMFMLHRWEDSTLVPVLDSATTAAVSQSSRWPGLQSASYRMIGMWDRRFMRAEEALAAHQAGSLPPESLVETFDRLAERTLSRDPRVLALARRYLTLEDVIDVWKHVVGSGFIGGKAVGMLLARAILRDSSPRWATVLEPHDSFFIASDVFYTFLVRNDCWWTRQQQKSPDTLLDGVGLARRRILRGTFPEHLLTRFSDMLEYFGQSPIIVRSSSLLEDAFGNAYAGKYASVFCPNQGTHAQRLAEFLDAVREVYASALSEAALTYRANCGALDRDEQMALLVQRVSGSRYGGVFCSQVAGVGFSYNPFVWHEDIDPEAGMVRLVAGLGTRAVERNDDDYTRVIALNAPFKRPEGSGEEAQRYEQRRIDFLDLNRNRFDSGPFAEVVGNLPGFPVESLARRQVYINRHGKLVESPWSIDLDRVLEQTPLVEDMQKILATLRDAYGCPVDVEFTVNVDVEGTYRIDLLQCRPLQIQRSDQRIRLPVDVPREQLLLSGPVAVLGYSREVVIDRLVYVSPSAYASLTTQRRHALSRVIDKLAGAAANRGQSPRAPTAQGLDRQLLLMGPGRWGSEMPELGVPVTFHQIRGATVLCEIDTLHAGLSPDLSLGTHFFHEMVEADILYLGIAHAGAETVFEEARLLGLPNQLAELLPDDAGWSEVVHVVDFRDDHPLVLGADHLKQQAVLLLGRGSMMPPG